MTNIDREKTTRFVSGLGPVTTESVSIGARLGMNGWDMMRIAPRTSDVEAGKAWTPAASREEVVQEILSTATEEINLSGEINLPTINPRITQNPIPHKIGDGPLW